MGFGADLERSPHKESVAEPMVMFPKDFEKFASGRLAFGLASRLPKRAAGVGFVMSSLLGRPVAAGQTQVSTGSAWLSQTVSSSLLLINKHP